MVKILSIGNSFSQDCTRYLYGIARADGVEIKVVNLYIGGCDLARHYRNMLSEEAVYSYEIDGIKSGLYVSLKQALLSDFWDIVTIQQQSLQSASFETFEPYLSELVAYVRKILPRVKIYMNQTWGYADGSEKMEKSPFTSHEEMFSSIRSSYEMAVRTVNAFGLIPTGEAMAEAVRQGRDDVHRDGFHLSHSFGRYLAALVWYKTLLGRDVTENTFRDFDKPTSETDVLAAKEIATLVTHS
jgi:hypothetical protein